MTFSVKLFFLKSEKENDFTSVFFSGNFLREEKNTKESNNWPIYVYCCCFPYSIERENSLHINLKNKLYTIVYMCTSCTCNYIIRQEKVIRGCGEYRNFHCSLETFMDDCPNRKNSSCPSLLQSCFLISNDPRKKIRRALKTTQLHPSVETKVVALHKICFPW